MRGFFINSSPGSVIADIQLKFSVDAYEPLVPLEQAVRSGKCEDLVVDKTYFRVHTLSQNHRGMCHVVNCILLL